MSNNYRALLLGIGLAFSAPCAFAAHGATHSVPQTSTVPSQEIHAGQSEGRIVVALDKSKLVHFDRAFREISVGSKDIAEVLPMSRTLIYVLGRKYGTTNLTLKGQDGDVLAVVDVVVTYDIDGLRQSLHNLVPDENIAVSADGDAISLSGQVSSADHLRQILAVADHYAPGKVTNMLSLGGSQQVLLEVKFAEVSALRHQGARHQLEPAIPGRRRHGDLRDDGVDASGTGLWRVVGRLQSRQLLAHGEFERAAEEGAGAHPGGAQSGGAFGRHGELPGRRRVSHPGGANRRQRDSHDHD